ncbi:hypothetical protein E2C01_034974 [Portunus trituberculatus]|uniref:Uncharacterized protein n=1 Tax=Portunus trituberculatus TaxID=210409 RepID=A0A5B7FA82_PORTR|nr:hypothetical protein [Portunus trituberculatus]
MRKNAPADPRQQSTDISHGNQSSQRKFVISSDKRVSGRRTECPGGHSLPGFPCHETRVTTKFLPLPCRTPFSPSASCRASRVLVWGEGLEVRRAKGAPA